MAERICRAWRRYSTVRIYRYYRDLIRFRERGDPAVLLRAVNPREANMSDAACGTHVRFRLGGATFPPIIFYKIYTHRPVTDMCAFSPRDYVAAALEKKQSRRRHTVYQPGETRPARDDSMEGWYKRIENNGWRPVSERVLVDVDEVTARTAAKAYTFHFDPGMRREDKIRRQKQKQREWMMKMYANKGEGEGGAATGVGTVKGTRRAPGAFGGDDEDDDLDAFLDEDEMELLNWSTTLDFESYQQSWRTIATSSRSEATVPIGSAEWELAVAAENGLLDSMGNLDLRGNAFESLEAELNREQTHPSPFLTQAQQ